MSDLEALYAVQALDSTIDQLMYRRAHLDERAALTTTRRGLATVRAALGANADVQRQAEERYRAAERKGQEAGARQARLEAQLRAIVVTREAEALQRQIAGQRAERETADEEGLGLLEEMETLAAEGDRLVADVSEGERAEAAASDALAAAEAEVDAQLADVRARRAEAAGAVPGPLLAHYEQMRPRFQGVAVARLQGSRCTGCHLDLSRVELEAVRAAKPGEIVECPQCARILVP
jgi:predicted  nucleic acid-binding Zn-ribbon protein